MTVRGLSALLVVLLAVGAASLVWWRCESEAPQVEAPEVLAVGREGAEVALRFSDAGSGLRRVSVVLQHADGEEVLHAPPELPGSLASGGTRKPSEGRIPGPIGP